MGLRHEADGRVDGHWPTTQIPHSFSSCHLQLESLSHSVIILQRMWC